MIRIYRVAAVRGAIIVVHRVPLVIRTVSGTKMTVEVAYTFAQATSLQDVRARDQFLFTVASGTNTVEKIDLSSGAKLLAEVNGFLNEHGWRVDHLDATVICEAPRLSPHRDEMRVALGHAVGLDAREVNVKFATNEGMGAIGRGEGIAALAVATLDRTG